MDCGKRSARRHLPPGPALQVICSGLIIFLLTHYFCLRRREIISRLRSVPGLEVWERHEVPAELHYKASKNSPPILVLARPRNIILSRYIIIIQRILVVLSDRTPALSACMPAPGYLLLGLEEDKPHAELTVKESDLKR